MKKLLKSYNVSTIFKAIGLMGRRKWLFLGCIFGFCGVEIAGSALYASGIRGAIASLSGADWRELARYVGQIALSQAIWWGYAPIASYCCALASKEAVQKLRVDLFERIERMQMRELDKRAKGEVLSALTNDIDSLSGIYDGYFFHIWRTLLGGIAGVALMAAIDWRFAIVVFALGSLSVFISARFNSRLEKTGALLQERLAGSSADAHELIKGAKTLRLLRMQPHILKKTAADTQAEADARIESGRQAARMKAAVSAVNAVSLAAILIAGALLVYFGMTDWGAVVALMGLKGATDMLFVEFGQLMAGMQACVAGVKRLFALMRTPIESEAPRRIRIEPACAPLVLENVTFAYAGAPVIEGLSMTIKSSGLTVLAGESGVGKSTVMKLILGLYAPQKGRIVFDGREPCTLRGVRQKTAFVPQEPMLFGGSVLENIRCGNPAAAQEDVERAARLAGAHGFISRMEAGYDTVLADDGKSLSGGQRQRIAIARALVKDAPILLLDEITSALDGQTQERIIDTIAHIAKDRAVLFITHRQAVIRRADALYRL